MSDIFKHHGVKGMKWGVIRPDGPDGTVTGTAGKGTPTKSTPSSSSSKSTSSSSSSKSTASSSSKPALNSPGAAGSPGGVYESLIENEDDIRQQAEFLRSIGRSDLAEKLEADYAKQLEDAKTLATESGELEEEEDEEDEEGKKGSGKGGSGKKAAGKGRGGAGKKKEEEKKPEEKKPEEKKKAGGGGAAAKPKGAALNDSKEKKKAEKKAKEEANKKEIDQLKALATSQQQAAADFKSVISDVQTKITNLSAASIALTNKLSRSRQDLINARRLGNEAGVTTIQKIITDLEKEVATNNSEIETQKAAIKILTDKAAEWSAKAEDTLINIKKKKEGVDVKHANFDLGGGWFAHKIEGIESLTPSNVAHGPLVKTEDGVGYPAKCYLDVPDPQKPSTWGLRTCESVDGTIKMTKAQLGRAASALGPGFRGNRFQPKSGGKSIVELKKALVVKYRSLGVSDEDIPSYLLGSMKQESLIRGGKVFSHYGIKGMRWGIRRTPAQLGRRIKKATTTERAVERRASSEAKTLSDAELKAKVARLNLERQYVDLQKQEFKRDRSAIEEGSAKVAKMVADKGFEAVGNSTGRVFRAVTDIPADKALEIAKVDVKKKKY